MNRQDKVVKYQHLYKQSKLYIEDKYQRKFSDEFLSALLGHHFDSDDVHIFIISQCNIEQINIIEIIEHELKSVIGYFEFFTSSVEPFLSENISKAKVKNKGLIWYIHYSDKDTKPSCPHAHEYKLNLKIHLGTGELYKKNKKVGKLDKNEFSLLRKKIFDLGIELPENI